MPQVWTTMARLVAGENGQDLMEYGLLAGLIAIVAMVSVSALGDTIYNVFWKQIGGLAL
jgi:Flp pilus assembly pilin Flp